jgi:hypothetical protein
MSETKNSKERDEIGQSQTQRGIERDVWKQLCPPPVSQETARQGKAIRKCQGGSHV